MEAIQTQRHRTVQIQDQENVYVTRGKINFVVPSKRSGLSVRGALGDLNTNVQAQRDTNIAKIVVSTTEAEKKTVTRGVLKSNYGHVQSKIDTGLTAKNVIQPTSKPPLRREESTGILTSRGLRAQATLRDTTNKQTDNKEAIQSRKCNAELKKSCKLPTIKENTKAKNVLKPILKESTESLGKLKLAEKSQNSTSTNRREEIKVDTTHTLSSPSLPDDIEDIDASDNNPLLLSVYIKDIYNYLLELEEKYPIEVDHLRNQSVITAKMRATLIDWLVEVQRQFSLVLETFHLTVGIIDRYLQAVPNIQRNQLQLVGVTAMFIASKYEEIYIPDVDDFVYVTDNAYSKADVFRCERDIMSKLGYCLARPIPLSFLRRFVKAAHGSSKNHHLAKYFVDLCLLEYSMAHYRPSELAAAAICLSLHLLSNKSLAEVWTPTLSHYSTYTLEHINPIVRKIAKIVTDVDDSKFKAVQVKYLEATLAKVAALPQLKSKAIYELAKTR